MPMSRARRMRRRSAGRSAYQPASPLPVTPKRSTLASVTCRSAFNHAGTRFAEGGEPAQTGGQGIGINRRGLSDSRAWRATALSRLRRSSCSIMVYARGRFEPRSLRTFAGGLRPVHSGTDWAYAVGRCISITLSISTSAGLRRPQCALMICLSDVAYFDMAVLGDAYQP